jgi:transcriptional regulator with XRE-family HTH domain
LSPFSRVFRELRMRHGIRQAELAEAMGYEQTYISAIEVGTKGPPTAEFVGRLIQVLSLSSAEQQEIKDAAQASERRFNLNNDLPEGVFWMVKELRDHIETLHPSQVTLIREIIRMRERLAEAPPIEMRRLRKRTKTEATM